MLGMGGKLVVHQTRSRPCCCLTPIPAPA